MTEHTLKKGFKTTEGKLVVGITANCEAKQENSGYQCGDCNGVFAANIFNVDRVGGNEGTWDAHDRGDTVVSVHNTIWRRCCIRFPCVLEILWKKGIEKRVPHSNRCPAKPDEACCNSSLAEFFLDEGCESR